MSGFSFSIPELPVNEVDVLLDPSRGRGLVHFYQYPSLSGQPDLIVELRGDPWVPGDGYAPFGVRAQTGRENPSITIVASRSVSIDVRTQAGLSGLEWYRLVRIVRTQSAWRANAPPSFTVAEPRLWRSGASPPFVPPIRLGKSVGWLAVDEQHDAWITTDAYGTHFKGAGGTWGLDVFVKASALREPSAYAYRVREDGQFWLDVIRTGNVNVEGWVQRASAANVWVREMVVSSVKEVPGEVDFPPFFVGKDVEIIATPSPEMLVQIEAFEFLIGVVPVLGVFYEVGKLVNARLTGRDFFGREVSDDEIAVGGVLLVLGMVPGIKAVAGALRRVGVSKSPTRALLGEVRAALGRGLGIDAPDIVGALGESGQEFQSIVREFAREGSAARFLGRAGPLVEAAFARAQRESPLLGQVLTAHGFGALEHSGVIDYMARLPDHNKRELFFRWLERARPTGAGVREALYYMPRDAREMLLLWHYDEKYSRWFGSKYDTFGGDRALRQDYLDWRARKISEDPDASVDALTWAKRTRGSRMEALKRHLGERYVDEINELLNPAGKPSASIRSVFARLRLDVGQYEELVEAKRGAGWALQADHLFEQRFYSASPRGTPTGTWLSLDASSGDAVVVPKNSAVAARLDGVLYVHDDKTKVLKRLIPEGSESLFTPQQWVDAHVFALRSSGCPREVIEVLDDILIPTLRDDFGEDVVLRFDLDVEHFLSAEWPQAKRFFRFSDG